MAISMKKYVDIKSAINNIKTATEKDLIARIFTTSESLTTDVVECENIAEVGTIFGASSDEYKIAEKYFSFINKYARSPRKISFGKTFVTGAKSTLTTTAELNTLEEIQAGLDTRIIGVSWAIGAQSGSTSFQLDSEVFEVETMQELMTNLTNAVNANSDDILKTAKFVYNETDGKIEFVAGIIGNYSLEVSEEVGGLLKLSSDYSPALVEGDYHIDYIKVFEKSYQTSNNFATFVFLGLTDSTELATLANYVALNYPSEFMTVIPVSSSNYSTIQSAVATIDGVSLELCGATEDTGKFNFVMPMAITATTDYNKENGTVSYMYTQDNNMSVVVDTDGYAKQYDTVKVNYYGRTQQAGQKRAFYQNGVLQGNYQDQNIFVNEIWLKDALTTKFLNYMLLTSNWYANKSGQAIGQGLIVDIIDRAKLNGTITTEKEISEADKVYIYNVTSDENAWRQIYQEGYYLTTSIVKKTINSQETYVFNYVLLYSKGDSIKKVEGIDILI